MPEWLKKITTAEIRNVMAILTIIGSFTLLHFLLVKEIPKENRELLNIAVGFVFGGAMGSVYGFYFGASKKDKNEN